MSYQYEGVSLKEKVAVIIGGTSGIGRAIALGMAKEGAYVVPTSRDPKKVEKAVQEVRKSGSKSLLYPVDVTDEGQVEELARRVVGQFNRNDETLAYCASKGGLLQLTRALAREWAKYTVRVNAIGPGPIMTPANRDLLKPGSRRLQTFYQRIPMKRLGEPQEVVGAAIYLASDAASYVTGSCLVVDGGFLSSGV